nr:MAG TPA: hypothetical protein [Caudoviricetes sp.]
MNKNLKQKSITKTNILTYQSMPCYTIILYTLLYYYYYTILLYLLRLFLLSY